MSTIVKLEQAAVDLETTKAALMSIACLRKKENGIYPKWYISNGERGGSMSYVDTSIIHRNNLVRKKVWLYATDKLYWILDSLEGYTMQDFATYLSEKTEDSIDSWAMYLSRDLFRLPSGNVYEFVDTKLTSFVKVMTRFLYDKIKSNQLVLID